MIFIFLPRKNNTLFILLLYIHKICLTYHLLFNLPFGPSLTFLASVLFTWKKWPLDLCYYILKWSWHQNQTLFRISLNQSKKPLSLVASEKQASKHFHQNRPPSPKLYKPSLDSNPGTKIEGTFFPIPPLTLTLLSKIFIEIHRGPSSSYFLKNIKAKKMYLYRVNQSKDEDSAF